MKRRIILLIALGLLNLGLAGCANQPRTMPMVVLEKDDFDSGLPKEDRRFVSTSSPVTAATAARARVVYLRVSTPPGTRAGSREQHVATVMHALHRLGVQRLVSSSELQTLLQVRGTKFSFDREPDPSEWPLAEGELGPYMTLHVEYGFLHGSRRYVRIANLLTRVGISSNSAVRRTGKGLSTARSAASSLATRAFMRCTTVSTKAS